MTATPDPGWAAQAHESAPEKAHLSVRPAQPGDGPIIAEILAEAFPALYRSTFGRLEPSEIAALLAAFYRAGSLSLESTRLAIREERVVGLAILHLGRSIGRGSIWTYRRAITSSLRGLPAIRAFFGGLLANRILDQRIPRAADLLYVEALAVRSEERGQGVGTHLLADAAEWALIQGRTRLALHVLASNVGARRLYARLGFRPWHRSVPRKFSTLFQPTQADWGALLLARNLDNPR